MSVAQDVLFRVVGEEAVLLNLNTELYLGLDSIGTRMWSLLTEKPSIAACYDTLLAEYEVDPLQLRADLDEFLAKLVEQGLVEVSPEKMATTDPS